MMKGLELRAATGVAQGKLASLAPVRRLPVARRAPISRQQQPIRPASVARVNLRVAAVAEPAASQQPLPLSALKPGQQLEGRVVRVEQFGAFVNVGAAKDGLVHISQLSDGFVKNANAVVQPNQTVTVRVMSVDPSTGRIALSMKGLAGGDAEEEEDYEEEEEEDEVEGLEAEEEEDDEIEPDEGNELVEADEDGDDMLYQMREDDPEMSLESVAAFEAAADNETDMEVDLSSAMPAGPVGSLVSGTVKRAEDYGVFVEFQANGKTFTGLLPTDEAKVPAASLQPEELKKYVPEGAEVPTYIDEDVENIKSCYNIGDTVQANILEYTEEGKIALSQWADWEVEAHAADLDEGEEEEDLTVDEEGDPLAMDPLDLIDDEEEEDEVDETAVQEEEDNSLFDIGTGMSRSDLKRAYMATENQGRLLNDKIMDNMYSFAPRPLNKINPGALNVRNIGWTDTDFDLDEIELDDFWQESIPVPKRALKMMGLKRVTNEAGEGELVEREGAQPREVNWSQVARYNREKEVAAFVKDLMAGDEDEAEVPVLAYRRPAVLAAAVQNVSSKDVQALRKQTGAGMMDCKKALAECEGDAGKAIEWLRQKGMMGADKKAGRIAAEGAIAAYIHPGSRLGVLLEVNCETDFVAASDKFQALIGELGMLVASCPGVTVVSPEDVPAEILARERDIEMNKEDIKSKPEAIRAKIVEGRMKKVQDEMALVNQDSLTDPNQKVSEIIKQTIAAVGENIQVRRFVRYNLGEGLEKKSSNLAEEVAQQTKAKEEEVKASEAAPKQEEKKPEPEAPKASVQVSSKAVQELRRKSGAGMMDCKKALAECDMDMEKASDWLRKKGLASADKKAGRLAAEGVIASYIHPGSRLGVMMEVNCETDFVAASDAFNQLVGSLGMQVAASQSVEYVSPEDIPAEVYAREREIEMGREDLKSKPEAIRAKIAEGRTAKLAQEMTLLPQPFLADQTKTVEQAIKEVSAAVGEKISVRRFVKYQLGEGIEKKTSNLAEEVASIAGGSS
ncbi:chloroplast poly protein of elongation factor Ts precursor [Dunaliella salina]|uniref:Elongation factor Ts, mitochondrial n=1 Tax=Dunaliella salina TaxID=3046 RepID=A0ABQ7H0S8_DUNSA|nr:chloroplast poly protein of elongation factor Ts precursor [Dunaliella salina]|eukprot:KAF5840458.1 chloroplast poly protein of elongation factor Ts precursor [Dunaliella salina]